MLCKILEKGGGIYGRSGNKLKIKVQRKNMIKREGNEEKTDHNRVKCLEIKCFFLVGGMIEFTIYIIYPWGFLNFLYEPPGMLNPDLYRN